MTYFYITVAIAIILLSALHYLLKYLMPAKTRGEYLVDIMKEKDEELYDIMSTISSDLDCTLEAVVFTHYAMVKDSDTVNDEDTAGENFIILVNDMYSNAKKGFLSLQLRSSQDLTDIAVALADKNIVAIPKKYNFSCIDQVFEKLA